MRIAELYASRQGEGLLTGTSSAFIRVSGCNLRCWFCDTPHASWNPEGAQQSIDSIVADVLQLEVSHVVLTGGEPMLFPEIVTLCRQLADRGLHTTIETAGTIYQDTACDLMSISPKLAGSRPRDGSLSEKWQLQHDRRRWAVDVVRRLMVETPDYQLKFVVDQPSEQLEVQQMVDQLQPDVDPAKVWIMPQSRSTAELDAHESWLRPWCDQQGFQYCDRMHLRWYGNVRGT
ncbi:7-carboxy-7-deazaguanine synthase QueE [Rosistilla oblonga]|uniref:7-carboxy-7-deazaguanine synthase QueE n=1 Tax=Rosistilla oblonga TaxID=2527990 RepID=UPI003A9815F5